MGSSAETAATENDPRSLATTARSASASGRPAATSSSRRWARTSVSVSEASRCPRATSPSASSVWFSMIPLCTTARRPVQSRWGWAFSGVGLPWVAQRVWPIAVRRPGGAARQRPASASTEWVPSAARARQRSPSATRATPAES